MLDIWGYCLSIAHTNNGFDSWTRGRDKPQSSSVSDEFSPGARADAVILTKSRRHGAFVPRGTRTKESKIVGKLQAVTQPAIECRAQMCCPGVLSEDPWAKLKWRTVSNVLVVSARQFGNPVALIVQVKSGYFAIHGLQLRARHPRETSASLRAA